MRCLTLADALRSRGAECVFVCRNLNGNLISLVEDRGFSVRPIGRSPGSVVISDSYIDHVHWLEVGKSQDAEESIAVMKEMDRIPDWLIVDHYGIDNEWESLLTGHVRSIMVVDDLADRSHRCDVLLDQNAFLNQDERYAKLLEPSCRKLFGSKYALLRPQFHRSQLALESVSRGNKSILIFLGGVDRENLSLRIAEVVRRLDEEMHIDVLVGASNQNTEALIARSTETRFSLYSDVHDVASLMRGHTFAISAAGFAAYELAASGVPAILIGLSPIQLLASARLEAGGAAVSLSAIQGLPEIELELAIKTLVADSERRRRMSSAGIAMFDVEGGARICDVLFDISR